MTSKIAVCVWIVLFAATPVRAQKRNLATLVGFSESLQELSSTVARSVVQVTATGYRFESDAKNAGLNVFSARRSTGSGVILSDDGYIITNAHVVAAARTIRIELHPRPGVEPSALQAKVIGTDTLLDIALLKIDTTGLAFLPLGDSVSVKQGEIVLAFGSPRGMQDSVTLGVVSAPARELGADDPRIYIQTDAPINPGNSGGPLVDMEGRMIGINTFILSDSGGSEGIGFAIPSNIVRYAYDSLKKDGHLRRGQIGLNAKTITQPLATVFHLEQQNGVLVEDVQPEGPAEKAGIRVGDVILSIGGVPLHSIRDLYMKMFQYDAGDVAELQLLRQGQRLSATVTVRERKHDARSLADLVTPEKNLIIKLSVLGFSVDPELAEDIPVRVPEGVLIVAIAGPNRYFGDQPREGDVIHAVNGRYVNNVETLRSILDSLDPAEPLILQVERNGNFLFLVLESD